MTDNPTEDVVFYVDYKDFEESINGRCVARTSGMPEGVIDWRIDPQVFSCVEKGKNRQRENDRLRNARIHGGSGI